MNFKHLVASILCVVSGWACAQDSGPSAFFGPIDLAGAPAPQVMSPRPVKGQCLHGGQFRKAFAAPISMEVPVYIHARPGEEERWVSHCRAYKACDVPVLFVTESWYRNVYLPQVSQQDSREQSYREIRFERNDRAQNHRDAF
jgi:hypothetical protein